MDNRGQTRKYIKIKSPLFAVNNYVVVTVEGRCQQW